MASRRGALLVEIIGCPGAIDDKARISSAPCWVSAVTSREGAGERGTRKVRAGAEESLLNGRAGNLLTSHVRHTLPRAEFQVSEQTSTDKQGDYDA